MWKIQPENSCRFFQERYSFFNVTLGAVNLAQEKLNVCQQLMIGMEIPSRKLNIVFDRKNGKYIDTVSGEKYEAVYKTTLVPKLGEEKLGFVRLFESLPTEYLNQSIADAKEVRIIQTYLTGVENLKLSLEAALKKGANVKILLMEPELESARLRSKGLINKQVNVRAKILDNRSELEELYDKYPGLFQLKYYNEIPGLNLFAVDDKLLIGFYWYKQYAIYGTYLEIKNDDYYPLAKNVNTHWNKLWESYSGETQQNGLAKVCYRCFFIREDDPQSFVLEINNFTKEAIVCETPSGDEYRGDVINLLGFCGIRAETVKAGNTYRSRSKRIASFLINTGNEESLGSQEIAIAVYSNISPQGLAYGNIMVLAKVANRTDTVDEEKKSLINEYLKNSKIKIANSNIRLRKPGWPVISMSCSHATA